MSLRHVIAEIRRHKRFLITAHTNLEGDALGSELAFYRLLLGLGKKAVIVNDDDIPYGYVFLPGTSVVRKFKDILQKQIEFDCFAALDCSDLRRTGQVYRLNARHKPVINIDHHISNENFGDANWVDPRASSASEMIYRLFKLLKVPFDAFVATYLYVGMLTDTGSFRYSNTTSFTHQAVSELLKYNLNVPYIYKNIYENIPFADMKLLSRILPGVKREAQGKIIWFQIKRNILKSKKLSFDLTEHVLTFARAIKDIEVAVIFKENLGVKDQIRINFRSQGKIDVNKIAQYFGGGGHKTASGATIHGKIDNIRRKVLMRIRESLK